MRPNHTLQLISVYSKYAGQTSIAGVKADRFGNAEGSQYDLGVDGAYVGLLVTVLHFYTNGEFDFSYPQKALESKGFRVHRWTSAPSPSELARVLKESCQLWVISNSMRLLEDSHLAVIKAFFDKGCGVYIWGDNQASSNMKAFLHFTSFRA